MDQSAFQKFILPVIVNVLGVLGKYFVPALGTFAGIKAADANDWWTATASVVAAVIVAGLTSWLTKKKILTTAAASADAKIEAVSVANDLAPAVDPATRAKIGAKTP